MAARETVNFKLQADIADLKRELASIPGITKAEAAKMARELQVGYNKAERAAAKAAKATKVSWADAGRGAMQVGAAIAGAAVAVVAFGQHMADLNNQLSDAATRTGLTVDQLAGLKLAAEGSGLEFAALEKGLNQLPKAMADTARGTGTAARAFKDMGIQVKDSATGGLRPAADLLPEIFEGLNALPDPASKSAAAMDIFGAKAGGALVQSGAIENLDAFVALADQFGIETGPRASAAAGEFQRQMATLKMVTEGTLAKALDQFGGAGGLNDVLELATQSVIVLGATFAATFDELNKQIQSVVGPLTEVALKVIDGDFSGALKAAQRNADELTDGLLNLAPGVLPVRLAAAAGRGLADGLIEAEKASAALQKTLSAPVRVPGGGQMADAGQAKGEDPQKAIDAEIEARRRAAELVRGLTNDRLSDAEKLDQAEADALRKLLDTEVATQEQIAAVHEEFTRRREDLREQELEHARKVAEEQAEFARSIQMAYSQAASQMVGATSSAFSTIASSMAETNKDGARAAFGIAKAAAIAQVGIDTAQAVSSVNAQWAAVPPVAAALSAAAIAVGAAQAGAIAAQQPTFHSGGPVNMAPDEQMAKVRAGEYVLNPTGRAMLGDRTLERANAGQATGGGEVVAVSVYKHTRQVDRWKRDGINAGDPISRAIERGRLVGIKGSRR